MNNHFPKNECSQLIQIKLSWLLYKNMIYINFLSNFKIDNINFIKKSYCLGLGT